MAIDREIHWVRRASAAALLFVVATETATARQTAMSEFRGSAGDYLGYSVAPAGDVDADGYQDLLVGAPRAQTTAGAPGGAAWIASGRYLATGLGAPRIQSWESTSVGGSPSARFGHALASGDIDRDGVPDVVVGAPRDATTGYDAGGVLVFSGATGLQLARFGGATSFAYGSAVAVVGDVNADGWLDILVGAPVFDTTVGVAYGHAYLLSGEWIARTAVGQLPVTPPELFQAMGTYNHDDFGHAVAPLGDLDGNGTPDFVIGCDRGGTANGGYFAVFLNGSFMPFVEVSGAATSDHFGSALASCGDVDGDSIPDLCVGAWGVNTTQPAGVDRGRVEVIRGAWLLEMGAGVPPTVSRSVWSRDGEGDSDFYGTSVAAVGDLDLDGAQEIAVSAPQSGYGTTTGSGFVDVVSGRDGRLLFRARGNTADAQFGRSIAGLGDVDADGRPDLAIGAPLDSVGGAGAGAVRLVRGFPAASLPACAAATPNSTGAVARLVACGSASLTDPALFLELTQAPPSRSAVFFRGNVPAHVPFGNGVRCVGGPLLRLGAATTSPNGALVRAFDLSPFPVGTTFFFQAWFDDQNAGGAGFNASDVAILTVVP